MSTTTLIILSSLFFLISCTEEQDKPQEQNTNNINTVSDASVPAEISPPVPTAEQLEASASSNTPDISTDTQDSESEVELQNMNDPSDSQEADISDSPDAVTGEENIATTVESSETNSNPSGEEAIVKALPNKQDSTNEPLDTPTFKVNNSDIVLGNADAKVVFIEYYSPTCPHCAYYNKTILPQLKKKYTDTNKIAYVIREFIGSKEDLDAAILQRCTNNINNFLKFQAVLLEQQDKWAGNKRYRELLTNIGKIGGIPESTYATCLKDDKIVKMLIANTNLANTAPGFIGTPAFFINGEQVSGGYGLENLSKQLDAALQQAK
ncbi:DsbA family protein [Candidatus Tisiphia endosymbiont of Beris chalybata]|uniref:DsbA family protein n=1 Tax=Candidatus Tisiphia endosymbiont of Beris chalybata TaxID=3066262 RepID=UPI00312CBA13